MEQLKCNSTPAAGQTDNMIMNIHNQGHCWTVGWELMLDDSVCDGGELH